MIMQQRTNEELFNLFIQSIESKDEKTLLEILEFDDESTVRDIVNRIPVHYIRKIIIELRNSLSKHLKISHLKWLQQILVLKFSVLTSMADGRSLILPLMSLLDDKSSPAYYIKLQALKGKLYLLQELKRTRDLDTQETVVRVGLDREKDMEVDSESETESEKDFHDEKDPEDEDDEDAAGQDNIRNVDDDDDDDDDNDGDGEEI